MKRIEEPAATRKGPSSGTAIDREIEPAEPTAEEVGPKVYLVEDGRLKPFSRDDYTQTSLYQVVESFTVESKLVRPEESGNLVYEGKKPSRKTVPLVIGKSGECVLLESWEALESHPEVLANAVEVFGANPVRQVFVLRRKEE
ncbi:MAG: hypothetical protein KBH99_06290 [Syntrophobacteraceae bacterium]|nr:hypothetical protein [Syntrophobacteraceae bacterium]